MTRIIIYLALLMVSCISSLQAQETKKSKSNKTRIDFETKIAVNKKIEKDLLAKEINEIDEDLKNGKINAIDADDKRKNASIKSANKIAAFTNQYMDSIVNRIEKSIEDKKIISLSKENNGKEETTYYEELYNNDKYSKKSIAIGRISNDSLNYKTYNVLALKYSDGYEDMVKRQNRRTQSQLVFAAGVNNVVTNGSVANSDFRYWGSHFYEVGLTLNTRLNKDHNLLHLKYGMSLIYNNLRPADNRYFDVSGNKTYLTTSPTKLDDSRFTTVNLVFPVHFELDFSKNSENNGKKTFNSHESFRMGLGGFAGFNLNEREEVIFNDSNNNEVTQNTKGGFNAGQFIYGLSAYIGHKQKSIYVKYDLNPLFANNPIKQNNISLGLRWDFN